MTISSHSSSEKSPVLMPGKTIGMVGGGQLGRMFAIAALRLGYEVIVLCDHEHDPAAQVCGRVVTGALTDEAIVERFARQCDVITLEFENIPAATMELCAKFAPVYPEAKVLATTQDRLHEKTTLQNAGLAVTPFMAVHDSQSLIEAGEQLGWPLIVKTATSGYDGKGQFRVESAADSSTVPWSSAQRWIAEQLIHFDLEVSVVVARTVDGEQACFPVFENEHRHHILDTTVAPARISSDLANTAQSIALGAAQTLGVVGLLCVELFVDGDSVMINEVAPRPHNSGHLTIEACQTCQFEQHVRAVCNLPLGSTQMISDAAAMANLLGDLWGDDNSEPRWDRALAVPGTRLHLYGKSSAKQKRKMGHITATGDSIDQVLQLVESARSQLTSVLMSNR